MVGENRDLPGSPFENIGTVFILELGTDRDIKRLRNDLPSILFPES